MKPIDRITALAYLLREIREEEAKPAPDANEIIKLKARLEAVMAGRLE